MCMRDGMKAPGGFVYASDSNRVWMIDVEPKAWIDSKVDFICKV